jgi:hypothetical protein
MHTPVNHIPINDRVGTITTRVVTTTLATLLAITALVACGGSGSSTSAPSPSAVASSVVATSVGDGPASADSGPASTGAGVVLPVTSNPINNPATATVLKIDSVLVEDNVDPATGKSAPDHLEIALTNTGTTTMAGFEVFYTFADAAAGVTENYYARLPADFTIAAGAKRIAHFDNTGKPDHFPVSDFSLYKTSTAALTVKVVVSATGAATQTAETKKDAGGAETAD